MERNREDGNVTLGAALLVVWVLAAVASRMMGMWS